MAAYHITTFRTVPLLFFLFQEPIKAVFLDEFEVFNHAHIVFGAVSLIKGHKANAGKIFTFITEFHLVVQKQLASFLEKRALFVSRSATLTVSHSHSFSSNIIFQSKIVTANTTIHTTRRYQFFLQLAKPSTLLRK